MKNARRTTLPALVLALVGFSGAAMAQNYPTKPVTLIVPAAAGGPTDTVSRLVAEAMSRSLGQGVIVENISGAGGTIGMARVAKTPADGYTIAVWHVAQATAPALYDKLSYHVINDFDQIGRITDVPMTLVSKKDLPANTVPELLAWMKQNSGKITYGHAGIGSASHLCALKLEKELGIKMQGVAYRGTGPAMNDLLGGQFDIMCDQTTNTTNQIKDGKIKGFAVTVKQKVSSLPDLPTLDQSGIPGFEASAWHAVYAPKGLPKDVTDKLVAALQAALKDPKVIERFADLGTVPVPLEQAMPAAHKAYLTEEVERWTPLLKAAGAKGN